MSDPRRVKVGGDLFHPVVPQGAVYVGRSGPGLAQSPFANPFRLKGGLSRTHPLRGYLERGIATVMAVPADFFDRPVHDLLYPITAAVATAAYRVWLADEPGLIGRARADVAGQDLACWCPLPDPGQPDYCHGAVLLAVSNNLEAADAK